MTPDEAFQHDWIKEGMVHRTRNHGRSQNKRQQLTADHPQQDPYKVAVGRCSEVMFNMNHGIVNLTTKMVIVKLLLLYCTYYRKTSKVNR